MNRKELQYLAKRYLLGTATPEEKELLDKWYDKIHQEEPVEFVIVKDSENEASIKRIILENIRGKIKHEKASENEGAQNQKRIRTLFYRIGSAAAIVFVVGVALWYYRNNAFTNKPATALITVAAKHITKIVLPDGSRVWLSANSIFNYPQKFSNKVREVELLDGRAFFDVKHINGRPFFVKTKSLDITVLGTSFDVFTHDKEGTTKVSVITGKVGITRPDHPDEPAIMLLPKQQAVLNHNTNRITKERSREPVVNLWCKPPLVFEQENLNDVFTAIEKQYNTRIQVENRELLDERISITLSNQRLDTIMEILSFTKHFKYQIANDSTVIIK